MWGLAGQKWGFVGRRRKLITINTTAQKLSEEKTVQPNRADKPHTTTRVLVQGNMSSTWNANLLLAGALAFVCLGIGIAMAVMGYWLILPFAGLEVIFFTACLHRTLKKLSRREVITIDDHSIMLEWGYNKADTSVCLPRYWSKLRYQRPKKPLDIGSVSLHAHGKRYTLGTSLGRAEKQVLYAELKSILATDVS